MAKSLIFATCILSGFIFSAINQPTNGRITQKIQFTVVNSKVIEYRQTRFIHDESEFKNPPIEIIEKRLKRYRISTLS